MGFIKLGKASRAVAAAATILFVCLVLGLLAPGVPPLLVLLVVLVLVAIFVPRSWYYTAPDGFRLTAGKVIAAAVTIVGWLALELAGYWLIVPDKLALQIAYWVVSTLALAVALGVLESLWLRRG